jgi:two-component system response regulator (stage 0 sporulation protein A)
LRAVKKKERKVMNKIIKTIIIDDNSIVVNNLKTHFNSSNNIKVVATFVNGEEALNFLINHNSEVDLVLMDILLPGLDGMSLLEEIKNRKLNKKIIIMSNYKDDSIINKCSEYDVSYYIIKPFSILALDKRINDAFSSKSAYQIKGDNLDYEISQLLHNLGIPSHIRGYKYIKDGIMILYNNDSLSMITKEIYPQIAYKYETTPSRVERAIRHAIEVSWVRGDLNLMEDLFGFSVSSEKAKPTNSEFLSTIAERIKMNSCLC